MIKNKKLKIGLLSLAIPVTILPIFLLQNNYETIFIKKESKTSNNTQNKDFYQVNEVRNNGIKVEIKSSSGGNNFDKLKLVRDKTDGWSNWGFGDEGKNYPLTTKTYSHTIDFLYNSEINDFVVDNIDSYKNIGDLKIDLNIEKLKISKSFFGGRNYNTDKRGETFDNFSYISSNDYLNNSFSKYIDGYNDIEINKIEWSDYLKLTTRLKIENDFNKKNLKITLKYENQIKDSDSWDATNGVYFWDYTQKIVDDLNGKTSLNLIMPYSQQDVQQVDDNLRNIVGKPINFFSDDLKVYSPKNLEKIQEIFRQRINNFYNNSSIKNTKIGTIDSGTTKFTYLSPPSSQVDKITEAKHKVTFALKGNDVFIGKKNGNDQLFKDGKSLTFDVDIKIYPNSNGEYNPKDLITITPYEVSELNESFFNKNGEIDNMTLSQCTAGSKFENFSINLNKKNNNDDYVLIPKDKIPLIIRYGLKLNFDLKIKENNQIIDTKNVDIFYLYNDDVAKIEVDFDIDNTKKRINLLIKLKNNQVLIENNGINDWNLERNFELIIDNVNSSLPSDQSTKIAKWIKDYDKESSDVNDLFITEEPFFFEMNFLSNPNSTSARYVPFIDGVEIGQSGANKSFKADLGPYILTKKEEEKFAITIEIKEFDPSSDSYSKVVYTLRINVELNNQPLQFELKGWDSPTLTEEDKKKYFDPEDTENYRGEYVDEKTGMYIPKIVWVNSIPPKTFMYDPLDKNGEKLSGIDSGDNQIIKYDIGYLAQINAPGFKDGDFKSMPTIGGYKIEYPPEYIPNGKYPYTELYNFQDSSPFPIISKESLTNNGMIFADKDLRQTILKKNKSDSFVYQFAIISPDNIPDNLFKLYDKFVNEKKEKIFVDFWDTYHGNNLFNYLKNINLVQSIEEAKNLEFSEVNAYWNAYVNYVTSSAPSDQKIDLNSVYFNKIILHLNNIDQLVAEVKRRIDEEINSKISKPSDVSLKIEEDYLIEINNEIFLEKIKKLFDNYTLEDPSKGNVSFEIIATSSSKYIKNRTKINVLNTEFIPFDLSKINGQDVLFNSEDSTNRPIDKFNWIKNDLIENLIQKELKAETGDGSLILNKDYVLNFYTNVTNPDGLITKKIFNNIDDAINNCLLLNVNYKEFSNDLYVEIKASNSSESYKLEKSYTKHYNNSNKNKNPIIDARKYDLNVIKKLDILKFNTESKNFPTFENKKEFLINYINDYNNRLILNFVNYLNSSETRKPLKERDFKITSLDGDKSLDNIIDEFINISNPEEFDISITIKIEAINSSKILENQYLLTINNSSKNNALPDVDDNSNEDNIPPSIDDENLFKPPQVKNSFWAENNWWIITLISVTSLVVISLVLYRKIKKNRTIR
ncbi:MAG: hypothetical protein ACRCRZ_01155 [Metamycoplasmataceae bacterium]